MLLGKMDRYVRIEQKSETINTDYGSRTETWTEYKTVWATIKDVTTGNQERTNSDLRLLTRPCEVIMHYDSGIDATMRLVMLDRDNRILQIVSKPAELGRREGITFMCEEHSA